jgi:diguanylate cyclase (GGDEF)-like protein/PAS domain S-box-containing protein
MASSKKAKKSRLVQQAGKFRARRMRAVEFALRETNERLSQQVKLYELTEVLTQVGHWIYLPGEPKPRWSKGIHAIVGRGSRQLEDASMTLNHIHPDDRQPFLAAMQAMDGQPFEYRAYSASGELGWFRTRAIGNFENGELRSRIGVLKDITVEREALDALRGQLQFIQKITSRVPGMVFQLERRRTGQLSFPFVSDGIEPLFRVTPEQARSDARVLLETILPQDSAMVTQALEESASNLTPLRIEFRVASADGGIAWLLASAVPQTASKGRVVWYGAVTDISQQKTWAAELQESEARFRSLTELSSDWYWEQDDNFRVVRLEGAPVTGSSCADVAVVGQTFWETGARNMGPEDWARHRADLAARRSFHELELQAHDAHGQLNWMALSGQPIFEADGRLRGYRGVGWDITARKLAEQEIQRLAYFDVLTGLPNRRMLTDRLETGMAASTRNGQHGALLFIDLDKFKQLNDTHGHDVGDLLLQQVAQRLRQNVREMDTVARLGGDEFVVMLQSLGSTPAEARAQVQRVGNKLLAALSDPYVLGDLTHHSAPSMGATLFLGQTERAETLLKQADTAMYQAKAAGGGGWRFYLGEGAELPAGSAVTASARA